MARRLRNRIVIFLVLAGVVAFILVRLSGRQPLAKISAVPPVRENVVSSISSNGKVEPIAPFVVRAQLDTFVGRISAVEGQAVKKGQLLFELNVKDASAQLAETRSKLLRAEDDLRAPNAGGRSDEAAKTASALAAPIAHRDRLTRTRSALGRSSQSRRSAASSPANLCGSPGTLCPIAPGWARLRSFPSRLWPAGRAVSANSCARWIIKTSSCCPMSM